MTPIRPRLQVDASPEVVNRAKAVAYARDLSLTEFVLKALAKEGDAKLKKLIENELAGRTRSGTTKS